jgi:hypothetical protein
MATAVAFEGAALVYSVDGLEGLTIDPATGIVSIPTAEPMDETKVMVTVTNSGGAAEAGFMLTVEAAAIAPVLSTLAVDAEVVPPVVSFQTDQDGLACWMVDATPTATAAAVKAGAGEAKGQLAVDQGVVTEDVDLTGVAKGVARYFHIMLENANGQSNVLSLAFEIPKEVFASVVATGGTVVDYTDANGDWRAHVFTGSDTFNVISGGEVEYLIVGGGGAGGSAWQGGGGGAGGFLKYVSGEDYNTGSGPLELGKGEFDVVVGLGGLGVNGNARGGNGGNSSFDALTAFGGGGGGENVHATTAQVDGASGGSGGGGGGGPINVGINAGRGGAGTPDQGHGGGTGRVQSAHTGKAGGGGGGAGAPGLTPSGTGEIVGHGGDGLPTSIIGASVFYAGGGAGSNRGTSIPPSLGGLGGGGNAARDGDPGNGEDGTPGTGGGGGGSFGSNTKGGDGGSGVVILRYKR